MDFEKIAQALSTETYKNVENRDVCKYHLLNVTDSKIYALDKESYKPCGFNFAVAKDEESGKEYIVIDFDSRIEMSFSAVEKIDDENFKEFSIQDEIDLAVGQFAKENEIKNDEKIKRVTDEIAKKMQKEYDSLQENYESLVKAHDVLSKKIESYEKQEKEAEIERHKNDINSLIDSYSAKLGKCSSYLVYKANIEKQYSKTHEEVEQDLILMAGKYLTRGENLKNKNFCYTPTEAGVIKNEDNPITNRYGHLLDKYIK